MDLRSAMVVDARNLAGLELTGLELARVIVRVVVHKLDAKVVDEDVVVVVGRLVWLSKVDDAILDDVCYLETVSNCV